MTRRGVDQRHAAHAALVLLKLAAICDRKDWREAAEKTLRLLAQRLQPRQRGFQQRILADLDEILIHGAAGELEVLAGQVPLPLGLGEIGFRALPLLLGPCTGSAQEDQAG